MKDKWIKKLEKKIHTATQEKAEKVEQEKTIVGEVRLDFLYPDEKNLINYSS